MLGRRPGFEEDGNFLAELPDQQSRFKVVSQLFAKCIFNHNSHEHSLTKTLFPAIIKGDFRRVHLQRTETRGRKRKSGDISQEAQGDDPSTETLQDLDEEEQQPEEKTAKRNKLDVAVPRGNDYGEGAMTKEEPFSLSLEEMQEEATQDVQSSAGLPGRQSPDDITINATKGTPFALNVDFSTHLQGMIYAAQTYQTHHDIILRERDELAQGIEKICGYKGPGTQAAHLVGTLTIFAQDLDDANRGLHGRNKTLLEELDKNRAELDWHEKSIVALRAELMGQSKRAEELQYENEWTRAGEEGRAKEHIRALKVEIVALSAWKQQAERNIHANISGPMLKIMLPEE